MDFISLLKDWIIPVVSLAISIWFAASAKKDADRAQIVLDNLNKAMKGWQDEIMSSSISLLNSNPQIINGKKELTQSRAAEIAVETIKDQLADGRSLSDSEFKEIIRQLGLIGAAAVERRP